MGNLLTHCFHWLRPRPKQRAIMVGLKDAGKTSILERLGNSGRIETLLSIGINLETITLKGIKFMVWDASSQQIVLQYLRRFMDEATILIFVVDSSDRDRLDEARDSLHELLRADSKRNTPLLVYANKQDLPDAMPMAELVQHLFSQNGAEQDGSDHDELVENYYNNNGNNNNSGSNNNNNNNSGNSNRRVHHRSSRRSKRLSILQKNRKRGLVDRPWYVQPCSSVDGRGLREGLVWLKKLESKPKRG